jgi:hypothetical protein
LFESKDFPLFVQGGHAFGFDLVSGDRFVARTSIHERLNDVLRAKHRPIGIKSCHSFDLLNWNLQQKEFE